MKKLMVSLLIGVMCASSVYLKASGRAWWWFGARSTENPSELPAGERPGVEDRRGRDPRAGQRPVTTRRSQSKSLKTSSSGRAPSSVMSKQLTAHSPLALRTMSPAGDSEFDSSLTRKELKAIQKVSQQGKGWWANLLKKKPTSQQEALYAQRRTDKTNVLRDFRTRLQQAGLSFADLKECEGLPEYKAIEARIDAFYALVAKKSLKEKVDFPAMGREKDAAMRDIQAWEPKLAAAYYKKASDALLQEVTGANRMALQNRTLQISTDLVTSSKVEGKPLTLKQVNEKLQELKNMVTQMKKDAARAPKINLDLQRRAQNIKDKYKSKYADAIDTEGEEDEE